MFAGRKIEVPSVAASVGTAVSPPPRRKCATRVLIAMAVLGTSIGGAVFGYDYWNHGRYLVSTDDAYVMADYTMVTPRISGYIGQVLVKESQSVKAGQVLVRIDDRDFRTARDRARADVDAAVAAIRNIAAETDLQHSLIEQAKAEIVADQASVDFARLDADRYRQLAKIGAGTIEQAQQTDSFTRQTVARLDRDRIGFTAAEQKVAVLTTQQEQALAQLDHARAVLAQTELALSDTVIVAPVDGTIGARSLQVGEYVAAGTQLMAVVPLDAVYVVGYFKATQLTDLRDGQPVEITADGFPDRRIRAHVEELSLVGGLEFSPDNAAGNFARIAPRIPVKIALDEPELAGSLRPGMSVEPTVNTRPTVAGRHRVAANCFQLLPDSPSLVATMIAALHPTDPSTHGR